MSDLMDQEKSNNDHNALSKEGSSTLAILFTDGPTALQNWSEL